MCTSRVLLLLLVWPALVAQSPGRVILVSLDGMGYEAWKHDPVMDGMTALREIAAQGVEAQGMTPHFPSTTANSHAALFTGAWGDINGITGNTMPVAPRNEHTAFERIIGYRSDGLRAEPIWITAARQGIRTVAQQVTQAYPFTARSVGEGLATKPVVLNGYQTRRIADHRVLHRKDVTVEPCLGKPVRERPLEPVCFAWTAGPVALHAMMLPVGKRYRMLRISTVPGASYVEVRQAPEDDSPATGRELARHFSAGLYLDAVPGSTPATIYFRLFEMQPDGSDFVLYQTPIQEFGMYDGTGATGTNVAALLRDAGGFIGNGPAHELDTEPFPFGAPIWKGGNGIAELRYLETMELVVRQSIRHTQWLWNHFAPQLFITYVPYPDEMEHAWKGLSASDTRYGELRRRGYIIVNRAVEALAAMRTPRDHLVIVSDHGMAAIGKAVYVNQAFQDARLFATGRDRKVDPAATRVMHLRNCLLLNTSDWKGGIVPLPDRTQALAAAETALRAIRDPETGQTVVTRIYDTPADEERFGYGGPNGADACFDNLPGYAGSDGTPGVEIRHLPHPIGYHGLDPSRPDMQAVLFGVGPGFPAGKLWPQQRAIDVAPLICELLGISPSAATRGRSPLQHSGAGSPQSQ